MFWNVQKFIFHCVCKMYHGTCVESEGKSVGLVLFIHLYVAPGSSGHQARTASAILMNHLTSPKRFFFFFFITSHELESTYCNHHLCLSAECFHHPTKKP